MLHADTSDRNGPVIDAAAESFQKTEMKGFI